ncbi:hypothetical protein A2U01_0010156 [Trifolium medium]|uniref:Uncharacterized protein n=1 Tax=Trifolium medium TaxID=97028 RepID=A0A392MNZ4_9FABA|nr:hypothetical protein [Trifolium medium]
MHGSGSAEIVCSIFVEEAADRYPGVEQLLFLFWCFVNLNLGDENYDSRTLCLPPDFVRGLQMDRLSNIPGSATALTYP